MTPNKVIPKYFSIQNQSYDFIKDNLTSKFSPVVAIPNAEVYHFGSNEKITQSTWPSVWFTRIKQKFLDDMEKQTGNAALRLALCDCLNEISEVKLSIK